MQQELPYLHDLSVFVGRKYFDGPSCLEDGTALTREDLLADPLKICFGKVPQSSSDEYCLLLSSLHERYPTQLEPLARSMQLSLT